MVVLLSVEHLMVTISMRPTHKVLSERYSITEFLVSLGPALIALYLWWIGIWRHIITHIASVKRWLLEIGVTFPT